MKKTTFGYSLVAATALVLAACSAEESPMTAGAGRINPLVELNSDIITTVSKSRSASAPTVDDLKLSLKSADGSYYKTWPSVAQFPTDEAFKIGKYTLEASVGSINVEGFEKPYYYGSTEFTVNEGRTTDVSLTATLANTMVSIQYTEAFKKYFTSYSAELHSEGGTYISYAADETRPAYLRPGKVTVSLDITKPNGTSATIQPATIDNAEARHHYRLTLDVNGGEVGDAVLSISFDDALDQETVTINLSDELMNAPAPTVTPEGFTPGQAVSVYEGEAPAQAARFMVNAPGGLGSVTLTTQSPSLIAKGWPAEIDLMRATEAQKSTMTALGLKAAGLWVKPERFAVVDLTEAISNLGAGDASFTVVVKDQMTKVNDPVTMNVTATPVTLSISGNTDLAYGANEAELTVAYDGNDFDSKVTFETSTDNGATWQAARVLSVNGVARAATDYTVRIAIPETGTVKVRALYCGKAKDAAEIVLAHGKLQYSMSVDAYATKALVKISGTTAENIAQIVNYGVVTLNGTTKEAEHRDAVSGTITLTGLNAATSYSLVVTLPDGQASDAMTFQTEAMLQVPNGDFENIVETINTTINQGGTWTRANTSTAAKFQTTLSMVVSEPQGWSSTNPTTCDLGSSLVNSWYVIPSVYNTGLSWLSHQPEAKVIGIGQSAHDTTADIYKGMIPQSGQNAMVVRSVAWDNSGVSIANKKQTGNTDFSNYYCSNKPSEIKNRTAGRLFIGGAAGNGVAFTSRPAALEGYYKYTPDGNDTDEKGVATVELLNGSTVVGRGTAELSAAGSYTKFKVTINYIANAPKAATLKLSIVSTNRADGSVKTTDYCGKDECCSRGAMLTVDNLSFVY